GTRARRCSIRESSRPSSTSPLTAPSPPPEISPAQAGSPGQDVDGDRDGSAGLLAVDRVLDGVLGVALDGLGPVEEVVGEVLRVVDHVGDEAGEGVLALGHLGLLFRVRPVRTDLLYAMRNITQRVSQVKEKTQKFPAARTRSRTRPPASCRPAAAGANGPSARGESADQDLCSS